MDSARAALAACPVAAIRVENNVNDNEAELKEGLSIGRDAPFPRPLVSISTNKVDDLGVYYLGHHNEGSFGATPYLILSADVSVMVDVPRFSAPAVRAVRSLAANGPDYMFLTHVDDTTDHNK